jgi:hypothetical protein
MAGGQPDFTGLVRKFSGALIDDEGVPHFEFALTLPSEELPHAYPREVVHYIDLTQDNAPSIVTLVVAACAFQFPIEVFVKGTTSEEMRVAHVQKTAALEN